MPTNPKTETVKEPEKEQAKPLLDLTRRVLLAAIGAVALAQDEIESFVNRLVERGEIAEKDGKQLLGEVRAKRKKESTKAEDEINKRIEAILERMKIPSKSDIDALSEKIALLTKKIDELKKS
jgi:poly(hydroxyalkanoate) granule-associated protein